GFGGGVPVVTSTTGRAAAVAGPEPAAAPAAGSGRIVLAGTAGAGIRSTPARTSDSRCWRGSRGRRRRSSRNGLGVDPLWGEARAAARGGRALGRGGNRRQPSAARPEYRSRSPVR